MTVSPYLPIKLAAPYMGVEQNAAYKTAKKRKLPVHMVRPSSTSKRPQMMVLREELLVWLQLEAKRYEDKVKEILEQREKLWKETYGSR